jgi:hypothetical protein
MLGQLRTEPLFRPTATPSLEFGLFSICTQNLGAAIGKFRLFGACSTAIFVRTPKSVCNRKKNNKNELVLQNTP